MRQWRAVSLLGLVPVDAVAKSASVLTCDVCESLLGLGPDSVAEELLVVVLIAFVALVFVARRHGGLNMERSRAEVRQQVAEEDVSSRQTRSDASMR